jgi:hypothetical protein
LVAEQVEKVDPDLIIRDREGKPYSVRYEAVNAMLLNEFLKAHRTLERQKGTIAQLQAADAEQRQEIKALAAALTEHAAHLRKIGEQVARGRAVTGVVVSDR